MSDTAEMFRVRVCERVQQDHASHTQLTRGHTTHCTLITGSSNSGLNACNVYRCAARVLLSKLPWPRLFKNSTHTLGRRCVLAQGAVCVQGFNCASSGSCKPMASWLS